MSRFLLSLHLWTWPWFPNVVHMQITQIFSNPYQFSFLSVTIELEFYFVEPGLFNTFCILWWSLTIQKYCNPSLYFVKIKPIPVSVNEAVTSKSHFSLAPWHIFIRKKLYKLQCLSVESGLVLKAWMEI